MKDPQELRHEARGFLDKAKTTTDRAVRRVLLERALRLAQQAEMFEHAASLSGAEPERNPISIEDSIQALPQRPKRRRA